MQSHTSFGVASLFFMQIQMFVANLGFQKPFARLHIWAPDNNVGENNSTRIDPGGLRVHHRISRAVHVWMIRCLDNILKVMLHHDDGNR